jgi:hypothetical protein
MSASHPHLQLALSGKSPTRNIRNVQEQNKLGRIEREKSHTKTKTRHPFVLI